MGGGVFCFTDATQNGNIIINRDLVVVCRYCSYPAWQQGDCCYAGFCLYPGRYK